MCSVWSPQPGPQTDAITATWCRELFYGGARGGGKSDYTLGDYLQDVPKYGKHWQGIIFRRTYPQLAGLQKRAYELFPPTGAEWKEGKGQWVWGNGARFKLAFLENDRDAENYQGHAYPWIGFEELGNFPSPDPYKKLLACNRWVEAELPTKRVRSNGNPGGAGQGWIKSRFIDHAPLGFVPRTDPETGHTIMFIPAKVSDNKILMERDPNYINTLRGSGSEQLVRAWLDGDWNSIVGGYFPEMGEKHLIEPMEIPKHWTLFEAMDWGSARPFSVLSCAVSDACIPTIPAGAIVVYREWYGASAPNVGLKMRTEDVAIGIRERRARHEKISYTVVDPAMFIEDGGPSHAEIMGLNGVVCSPADNKRVPGWQQIRNRLKGIDGRPLLFIVGAACPNLVRTLPALQHDTRKPEDVDTEGEDHSADALRYACMSRPYTMPLPPEPAPIRSLHEMTYNEVLDLTYKSNKSGHHRI